MVSTHRVILTRDNPNLLSMGVGGNQKLFESEGIRTWLAVRNILRIGYSSNTKTNTVWTVTRYVEGTRAERHFVFGSKRTAMAFKLRFG